MKLWVSIPIFKDKFLSILSTNGTHMWFIFSLSTDVIKQGKDELIWLLQMGPYWNKRSNVSESAQCIVCWNVLTAKTFKENQLKNILTMFIFYLRSLWGILRICWRKEAESKKYGEFKIWSRHNISYQPWSRVAT